MNQTTRLATFELSTQNISLRERADIESKIFQYCSRQIEQIFLAEDKEKYLTAYQARKVIDEVAQKVRSVLTEEKSQLTEQLSSFFEKLSQLKIDSPILISDLKKQVRKLEKAEMPKALFAALLKVKIIGDFSLTYEDVRRVEMADLPNDFSKITQDCACFAFYHLHDDRALQRILSGESEHDSIQDLGYTNVSIPMPGDLILYGCIDEGGLMANHFGIWIGDNRVISKWGRSLVMEHPPENVPLGYGKKVLFFRKDELRFPVSRAVIFQLAKAEQEGFSHFLTYSPLTAKGTKEVFLKYLTACFQEHEKKAFIHSFYGLRNIKPLHKAIHMEALALKTKNLTTARTLTVLQDIVRTQSVLLPLDFTISNIINPN